MNIKHETGMARDNWYSKARSSIDPCRDRDKILTNDRPEGYQYMYISMCTIVIIVRQQFTILYNYRITHLIVGYAAGTDS